MIEKEKKNILWSVRNDLKIRIDFQELSSPVSRPVESKGSMRCFTPRIIEANHFETPINPSIKPTNNNNHHHNVHQNINKNNSKPVIQSYQLKKKKMSPGYSLNDLDKFNGSPAVATSVASKVPTLSIESLKSILRSSDISYLDNGEICRHDIGGSAPDFKKIFVTEFI